MFMGHYATALVPYEKNADDSRAPFWLFLFAAQFLDFLMLVFVPLGLEQLIPGNFFKASFTNMRANMFLSHDFIPVLGWAFVFSLTVFIVMKNKRVALWCFGLIVFHELCDLIVGFKHNVMGINTTAIGFSLYHRAPVTGLVIETVLCATITWWYINKRAAKNRPLTSKTKWGLYLILVGGTLATIPLANQSLNQLLGLFH